MVVEKPVEYPEGIATAPGGAGRKAQHIQGSHLSNNQTDPCVCEFDSPAKTNIFQCKLRSGEYGGKYSNLHPAF
jgi:hypothetical protein